MDRRLSMNRRERRKHRTTRHKQSACLNCGKLLDASTSVDGDHAPSPGDATVCLDCQHLMMYADDMTLRNLTDEEMIEVAGDPRILTAMKVVAAFNKFREDVKRGKKV